MGRFFYISYSSKIICNPIRSNKNKRANKKN
jgi:hypothetical protein